MDIQVLLLCSRENAGKILDQLIQVPDITMKVTFEVQEFLSKLARSPFNLVITEEQAGLTASDSESAPAEVVGGFTQIQDYPEVFKVARQQFEREYLIDALTKHSANISQTAGSIGITRRNLQLKIRNLHIDIEQIREAVSR